MKVSCENDNQEPVLNENDNQEPVLKVSCENDNQEPVLNENDNQEPVLKVNCENDNQEPVLNENDNQEPVLKVALYRFIFSIGKYVIVRTQCAAYLPAMLRKGSHNELNFKVFGKGPAMIF
ncbi:hypothetical protein CHS0354_011974 [Potamilus streckersoni]|uniref:Uncharacterized protein n=1 Tax=Potamilus streckersoni TaxID=2493646 RepID=A0AAE0TGT5_9BIVA|nr:hypothetical protein CHS0354_011974 [Potamilus streckersoni]